MAMQTLRADVAGTIWKIEVTPGQTVSGGDTLIIIESMKMEIPVVAESGGRVVEILVAEQEPVAEGQELVQLEV